MATTQTSRVIVVNDYSNVSAQVRTRTTSRGTSQRVTIDILSEPLGFEVSATVLGTGPAAAIRDILSAQIKGITATVSHATSELRKRAAANLGAAWVQRRYGGGRTGFKPPSPTSVRMFNDSRRLADGVFVRFVKAIAAQERSATFTINLPKNRFDPLTFGPGLEGVIARFFSLVDMLRDPMTLAANATFQRAVDRVSENMVAKGRKGSGAAEVAGKLKTTLAKLFELGQVFDSEATEEREERTGAEG